MPNPLLDTSSLPRFAEVRPEHALPAVRELIAAHKRKLAALLELENPTFETMVAPLEDMAHELGRVWSPVGHLQAVLDDPAWREAYNDCLPLLTEHGTEMSQNKALQQAFERIYANIPDDAPQARRTLVEHALRDFRLAGVALPDEKKAEFRGIMQELAAVQAQFDQNLQDATDSWHFHSEDAAVFSGLPGQTVDRARQEASSRNLDGLWLTLDYPTYHAVMTHADHRELRERFYRAWSTRASDQGGQPQWDNSGNIEKILSLRHRAAKLVGFDSYAEYSLATKMAARTGEVIDFLNELSSRTREAARRELAAVQEMAAHPLEAWDSAYYLEK